MRELPQYPEVLLEAPFSHAYYDIVAVKTWEGNWNLIKVIYIPKEGILQAWDKLMHCVVFCCACHAG